MITLDYRTDNNRWGISGIKYHSWERYVFSLGYLANVEHYRNLTGDGIIDLHIERNDVQGAWGKEGRIHLYGTESYLKERFPDWYNCKSAGVGNITYRINSNEQMYSLVHDYNFVVKTYANRTTADIFPPVADAFYSVWDVVENYLRNKGFNRSQIENLSEYYEAGWNE